ncbi:MAG TPA: GNAT family N-acetyltransferase [Herpetosiphonaceae bacterium]|nr:GNAT family N-acetyltransferase [Herpetosiphonaceae bacterium]
MTHDNITIRPYEEADFAAVCAVHDRARPDELRGSCDPRAFVPLAEDPQDAADFARSQKHVACLGDRVVAFVGVDGAYISWLYVDPEFYGRGLGRRLLGLAIELAGPTAWTIALDGNERALELYRRAGFVATRTVPGDNAGYPCTCLRLELNPAGSAAASA